MNSTKHRNEAYQSIVDKLPNKRKLIFSFLQDNGVKTSQEIATGLRLPINEVTGRLTELKEIFLIKEVGYKVHHQSKKKQTTYRVVDNLEERQHLILSEITRLNQQKDCLVSDYLEKISNFSKEIILRQQTKIQSKINRLSAISDAIYYESSQR